MSTKTSTVTMFFRIYIFSFFITFVTSDLPYSTCSPDRTSVDKSWEAKLHEDLCFTYSERRPIKNISQNIEVKTRMMLKYFRFDDNEEILTIHSWFVLNWKDEYREWNTSDYGGIEEIVINSYQMWTPNIKLLNAADSYSFYGYVYTLCTLDNEGVVFCVPQVTHSALCSTKLKNWPFDKQLCTLKFGFDSLDQVNFTIMNPAISSIEAEESSGWVLIGTNVDNYDYHDKKVTEFQFEIQRVGGGLFALIVLPTLVISLLTIISLILDFKDYVRFIIIIFSLLCHLRNISQYSGVIPKNGVYTPLVFLFLRSSLALSCTAFLLTLVLTWMRSRVVPPPMVIVAASNFVLNSRAKMLVFTNWKSEVNVTDEGEVQAVEQWNRFVNLFNSVLVLVFGVIYLALIAACMPY